VYGKSGAKIMKQECVAKNKKRIESRRSLKAEIKGNKIESYTSVLCFRRYRKQEYCHPNIKKKKY
jgi:hypothetical protein